MQGGNISITTLECTTEMGDNREQEKFTAIGHIACYSNIVSQIYNEKVNLDSSYNMFEAEGNHRKKKWKNNKYEIND